MDEDRNRLWLDRMVQDESLRGSFVEYMDGRIRAALWRHTEDGAKHERINGEIDALNGMRGLVASYVKEAQEHEMAMEQKTRGG